MSDTSAVATAQCRAVEALLFSPNKRVCEDPYAQCMVPSAVRATLASSPALKHLYDVNDAKTPGFHEHIACRTRFFDDCIKSAVDKGCQQVVILGAGYDTRALRLSLPRHVVFIELDQPEVQAKKLEKLKALGLQNHGVTPQGHTAHYVPVNFNKQSLEETLMNSQVFDSGMQTVWLMEGVTMYIPRSASASTFQTISNLSVPGSHLLVTYLDSQALASSVTGKALAHGANKFGEPFISGFYMSEFRDFLKKHSGFADSYRDVGEEQYDELYLAGVGRSMKQGNITERFVSARLGSSVYQNDLAHDLSQSLFSLFEQLQLRLDKLDFNTPPPRGPRQLKRVACI